MGRFFLVRFVGFLLFCSILWMAGDRYGAPEEVRSIADEAFSSVEERAQKFWLTIREDEPTKFPVESAPEGQETEKQLEPTSMDDREGEF